MSQGAAYVRRPRVKRPIVVVSCAKVSAANGLLLLGCGTPPSPPESQPLLPAPNSLALPPACSVVWCSGLLSAGLAAQRRSLQA
jgi:hypothetical protein